MKCTNCGLETQQDFLRCPNCDAEASLPVSTADSASGSILRALKDPLFLVICILMSVSCLLSLSAGSVDVISILITVFLWLTYAQSRKDIADAKHLRCVSGTVYAQYVINYVLAGLVLLMGVIFAVAFSFIVQSPDFTRDLLSAFIEVDDTTAMLVQTFFSASGILVLVIFAFIAGIILLINIFTMRYFHRFAQSVYQSIETGTLALKHTNAAKLCLFIVSGCSAIGTLSTLAASGLLDALSSATGCAITLIAGLMIQKYFSSKA